MSPEECDAWYRTPRGGWIGEVEYRLIRRLLAPVRGARWHTRGEAAALVEGLALGPTQVEAALPLVSATWFARLIADRLRSGAFLANVAKKIMP